MKAYGGGEEQLHIFLTSALDGYGQLHAPVPLLPGKKKKIGLPVGS